jgi:hypothetical protein
MPVEPIEIHIVKKLVRAGLRRSRWSGETVSRRENDQAGRALRYAGGTILPASIVDELRRGYVEYDEAPGALLAFIEANQRRSGRRFEVDGSTAQIRNGAVADAVPSAALNASRPARFDWPWRKRPRFH